MYKICIDLQLQFLYTFFLKSEFLSFHCSFPLTLAKLNSLCFYYFVRRITQYVIINNLKSQEYFLKGERMKKCNVLLLLLAAVCIILSGCATHGRCIRSHTVTRSSDYCCSWYEGSCRQTCTEYTDVTICDEWVCDPGYKKVNGKCVDEDDDVYGTNIGKDMPAAETIESLRLKAEQGDYRAQYSLGKCYEFGLRGTGKDFKEAFKWYKKSADQDHYPSYRPLARLYELGLGTPKNSFKASSFYNLAEDYELFLRRLGQ